MIDFPITMGRRRGYLLISNTNDEFEIIEKGVIVRVTSGDPGMFCSSLPVNAGHVHPCWGTHIVEQSRT